MTNIPSSRTERTTPFPVAPAFQASSIAMFLMGPCLRTWCSSCLPCCEARETNSDVSSPPRRLVKLLRRYLSDQVYTNQISDTNIYFICNIRKARHTHQLKNSEGWMYTVLFKLFNYLTLGVISNIFNSIVILPYFTDCNINKWSKESKKLKV